MMNHRAISAPDQRSGHPRAEFDVREAPHVPAAFINAIAEEGTKAEAIEWLQKTWNENCELRAQLAALRLRGDRTAADEQTVAR